MCACANELRRNGVRTAVGDVVRMKSDSICIFLLRVQEDFEEGTTGPYSHLFQELLQPEPEGVAAGAVA